MQPLSLGAHPITLTHSGTAPAQPTETPSLELAPTHKPVREA